jgi:hypothetical protein
MNKAINISHLEQERLLMASNIDFISIDATYPIAGKDNDSQGFRDNFSIIKNNFATAKGDIEDLQMNTARLDVGTVDFNNNTITNVNLLAVSQKVYDAGPVNSSTTIDYKSGHYQAFVVNYGNVDDPVTFTITGFPAITDLSKITVELTADNTSRYVKFVIDGASTILKSSRIPAGASFLVDSSTNPIIFEFWTRDSGSTVFCDYLGKFT